MGGRRLHKIRPHIKELTAFAASGGIAPPLAKLPTHDASVTRPTPRSIKASHGRTRQTSLCPHNFPGQLDKEIGAAAQAAPSISFFQSEHSQRRLTPLQILPCAIILRAADILSVGDVGFIIAGYLRIQ